MLMIIWELKHLNFKYLGLKNKCLLHLFLNSNLGASEIVRNNVYLKMYKFSSTISRNLFDKLIIFRLCVIFFKGALLFPK